MANAVAFVVLREYCPLATSGFDPFVDTERLENLCRLDNSKCRFHKPMLRPESQDSLLQKLPLEVYQNCLQNLDVGTLTSMRAVSQYTRASIDSLHSYAQLYKFAPQALRACLSTGMARHIPLMRLHEALTSMECYYCKHTEIPESIFGTHLSLWEGVRICAFCARNEPLLKPAELTQLINLCSQRKSSLSASSLASIPRLQTVPGSYTPADSESPYRLPRTALILTASILIDPNKTLDSREARILSPRSTFTSNHHPFVREKDESDLAPLVGYVSPETARLAALRYASAVPLPHLTSSKTLEKGILCTECNLRMRYLEVLWIAEQKRRRQTGGDGVISTRRRRQINSARKKAARFYVVNPVPGNNRSKELSIQRHYKMVHGKVKEGESQGWINWKLHHEGRPALPLLTADRFWVPPQTKVKVAKEVK